MSESMEPKSLTEGKNEEVRVSWEEFQLLAKFGDFNEPASKFDFTNLDWNTIMPLVDKIAEYRLAYPNETAKVCDCKIVIGIKYLYPKVLEFITWYQSLKTKS